MRPATKWPHMAAWMLTLLAAAVLDGRAGAIHVFVLIEGVLDWIEVLVLWIEQS